MENSISKVHGASDASHCPREKEKKASSGAGKGARRQGKNLAWRVMNVFNKGKTGHVHTAEGVDV